MLKLVSFLLLAASLVGITTATARPKTTLTYKGTCLGLRQQGNEKGKHKKLCRGGRSRCLVYCKDIDLNHRRHKVRGYKWYCDYDEKEMDWEEVSAHMPTTWCSAFKDVYYDKTKDD